MFENINRRNFLGKATLFAAANLLTANTAGLAADKKREEEEDDDVSPVEDLMREHGLLNRVLLVYDHCSERLQSKKSVDLKALGDARRIIKDFVESYHEKLEEDYLFPRFEKAKKLTELVSVLKQQHIAGRALTAEIGSSLQAKDHSRLAKQLSAFTRMYRPHEAREDTVLFPAFQALVPEQEYKELGQMFESREHKLFGKAGFEGQVRSVEQIERVLGIYELSQFTTKIF